MGKGSRSQGKVVSRLGVGDRRRYRRLDGVGALEHLVDYEDAWESGVFDSRYGTMSQGMDDPYKRSGHWEWRERDTGRMLYRKGYGSRKLFNARAVKPRYKNVDRSTLRKDLARRGLETLAIVEGFYVDVEDGVNSTGGGFELGDYDCTPKTGVCKSCSKVMTYKEARLYDYDICWSCSMEIDEEMVSLFLEKDAELDGDMGHLIEIHEWLKDRYVGDEK